MSVETAQGGPDDGHDQYGIADDLLTLIEKHDQAKIAFGEMLRIANARPTELDDAGPAITHKAHAAINSWRQIVEKLGSDYGCNSDEFIAAIATLWLKDDQDRVQLLSELEPEGNFSVVSDGDIEKVMTSVRGICEENAREEIFNNLVQAYGGFLIIDVNQWEEAVRAKGFLNGNATEQKEADSRTRVFLNALGKHCVDVAKLGAGISIGILVANYLRKR